MRDFHGDASFADSMEQHDNLAETLEHSTQHVGVDQGDNMAEALVTRPQYAACWR